MARYEITLAEFDALPWDVKNTWIPKAGAVASREYLDVFKCLEKAGAVVTYDRHGGAVSMLNLPPTWAKALTGGTSRNYSSPSEMRDLRAFNIYKTGDKIVCEIGRGSDMADILELIKAKAW